MSASHDEKVATIKNRLKVYPNFPKDGIMFWDVFPLGHHPSLLPMIGELFHSRIEKAHPNKKVDMVVGMDSRGFLFGPDLAARLQADFIPARKAGKLPGKTSKEEYTLEYGSAAVEMQQEYLLPGKTAVIVDDLVATGGTMSAAYKLLKRGGVEVLDCLCVVELLDLNARAAMPSDCPLYSLLPMTD